MTATIEQMLDGCRRFLAAHYTPPAGEDVPDEAYVGMADDRYAWDAAVHAVVGGPPPDPGRQRSATVEDFTDQQLFALAVAFVEVGQLGMRAMKEPPSHSPGSMAAYALRHVMPSSDDACDGEAVLDYTYQLVSFFLLNVTDGLQDTTCTLEVPDDDDLNDELAELLAEWADDGTEGAVK